MAHWHDFNPWASQLVYLTSLREAAKIAGDQRQVHRWLHTSRLYGSSGKLDPYLLRDGPLTSGRRELHLGIRWGKEPEQYFSPLVRDEELALELYFRYGGQHE